MTRGSLTYTKDEVPLAAEAVVRCMSTVTRFAITGSLGAGKTTLIQEVLRQCGIVEVIQSPTFTYMSTYTGPDGTVYHHFDLYRLQNQAAFIEAGFLEYIEDPQAYVFIEWPEIIAPLLNKNVCFLAIEYVHADARIMRYELIT